MVYPCLPTVVLVHRRGCPGSAPWRRRGHKQPPLSVSSFLGRGHNALMLFLETNFPFLIPALRHEFHHLTFAEMISSGKQT